MSYKIKGNQKHLTVSQRLIIEKGLNDQLTFAEISRKIQKDPSTISKEIRKHRELAARKQKAPAIPCSNRPDCRIRYLCPDNCSIFCKSVKSLNYIVPIFAEIISHLGARS